MRRVKLRDFSILSVIWLVSALHDRLWFWLDCSVPAWDQAENLTGALNYWKALQEPFWVSGESLRQFWLLSSKMPPLTYILAGFVQLIFGTGPQQATLVHLFFSAVLLFSVYGLGRVLFNRQVGLWAAGLSVLFPALVRLRLEFLLDYPLTAVVALTFFWLTVWRQCLMQRFTGNFRQFNRPVYGWIFAVLFGVCFGLALLVKQTALFFIFIPWLWLGGELLRQRKWLYFFQWLGSIGISLLVCGPWYRTNWLLILTSGKRATVDSAFAEGDPGLNTLAAWTFYLQDLPNLISWPVLIVGVVGFLLFLGKRFFQIYGFGYSLNQEQLKATKKSWFWLILFFLGSYFFCSLNINKDSRYVLPYLPSVAIFLAYGLTLYPQRWGKQIRWLTVSFSLILMLLNVWPVGGVWDRNIANFFSPRGQHLADFGEKWPHQEVIEEVIKYNPYLQANLGILPSTPEINQHNFNYFGALKKFQVYARQVGTRIKDVEQDTGSMSWFITKSGEQGSVPQEAQKAIVNLVENGGNFVLHKTWNLPDKSKLKLYRHRQDFIQINPNNQAELQPIKLNKIIIPSVALPGVPLPVSYEWLGSWQELKQGIVLLTWKPISGENPPVTFLHDHGLGLGKLHNNGNISPQQMFNLRENLAMLPPPNAKGVYQLEAKYLNRNSRQTYAIQVPNIRLRLDAQASKQPAPELDLVTQMRVMAVALPLGMPALEGIFPEVARINQYDPVQDYTKVVDLALSYRIDNEQKKRSWAYAVGLSRILQQNVSGSIQALERVTKLDKNNPYAYGYLAFVYLYNWNGKAAEQVLEKALAINPKIPEIKALRGVARLMQGNIWGAWQDLPALKSR